MVYGQPIENPITVVVQRNDPEPESERRRIATVARELMNKITLYVKDSDRALWERAKALATGDESLSSLVVEGLALVVERRERAAASADQWETIELSGVDYYDDEKPRRLRFRGVLASSPRDCAIYVTKGKQVVLEHIRPGLEPNQLQTFAAFDEFKDDDRVQSWLVSGTFEEVADALGVEYFEEID
jgi:hypothetical protein